MLLKIDTDDTWTYYDGITECDVEKEATTLYAAKSEGDLDGLHLCEHDAQALLVAHTPEEWHAAGVDDPALIPVRVVVLTTRETRMRIAFDGQAFLCADDGLTLQRIKTPKRVVSMTVQIDPGVVLDGKQTAELAEELLEFQRNGGQVDVQPVAASRPPGPYPPPPAPEGGMVG